MGARKSADRPLLMLSKQGHGNLKTSLGAIYSRNKAIGGPKCTTTGQIVIAALIRVEMFHTIILL